MEWICINLYPSLLPVSSESIDSYYNINTAPYSLHNILWQKPSQQTLKIKQNTHLVPALHIWDEVKQRFLPQLFRFLSSVFQEWFPPGSYDPRF